MFVERNLVFSIHIPLVCIVAVRTFPVERVNCCARTIIVFMLSCLGVKHVKGVVLPKTDMVTRRRTIIEC